MLFHLVPARRERRGPIRRQSPRHAVLQYPQDVLINVPSSKPRNGPDCLPKLRLGIEQPDQLTRSSVGKTAQEIQPDLFGITLRTSEIAVFSKSNKKLLNIVFSPAMPCQADSTVLILLPTSRTRESSSAGNVRRSLAGSSSSSSV
jgi:hypothetical protein